MIILCSCDGQSKNNNIKKTENSSTSENKINISGDIYIGKIFFSGDELNNYDFIKTEKTQIDSLFYSIYKNINTQKYVFSLEKLLSNNDVEKYKILDTVNIRNGLNIRKLYIGKDNNKIKLVYDGKELKQWKFTANNANINIWNGTYNLKIDYGKLDDFSEMSIDYDIEINDKKCTFSGMGYKTYFTDLCEIEEKNNRLILKYIKTIDGDGLSDHSNIGALGIIEYKNNEYYLKSSIVADKNWNYNTDVKLVKAK